MRIHLTLGICAALAGCLPMRAGPPSATATVAAFERSAGIEAWPRLDGCNYAERFGDRTVGLVLRVGRGGYAQSRWDGRCHVPINHELQGMPAGLPGGTYVVAAKAPAPAPGDGQWPDLRQRHLVITAILGSAPANDDLVQAVVRRICLTPAPPRTEDRDCVKP
jgi:hypothetical protein